MWPRGVTRVRGTIIAASAFAGNSSHRRIPENSAPADVDKDLTTVMSVAENGVRVGRSNWRTAAGGGVGRIPSNRDFLPLPARAKCEIIGHDKTVTRLGGSKCLSQPLRSTQRC